MNPKYIHVIKVKEEDGTQWGILYWANPKRDPFKKQLLEQLKKAKNK